MAAMVDFKAAMKTEAEGYQFLGSFNGSDESQDRSPAGGAGCEQIRSTLVACVQ
jgi:hypothetical protein